MPPLIARCAAALALLCALTTVPAGAQPFASLGQEFQVNAYTLNIQTLPEMAADGEGDFVVVWISGQDGAGGGIFGRRFTSAGVPLAAEFQVNTYTPTNQTYPAAGMDATGNFVVVWESVAQDNTFGGGVFAQRFNAAGSRVGTEFQVNVVTTSNQDNPDIAMNAAGQFVIVWHSDLQDGYGYGIFGRRFAAGGAALGGEFQINTYTSKSETFSTVAIAANGDFVVAWTTAHDGQGYGIFGQRFASSGARVATEFQVNTLTTGDEIYPTAAINGDGAFVVAWQGFNDGYSPGIFAQRFDSAGVPRATEFQVNTVTLSYQKHPKLAVSPGGDFVVAWESGFQDGNGYGMFARHYDSAGTPLAAEFQVNSYTTNSQYFGAVTAAGARGFVVAWTSKNQDGSFSGVFAQRYTKLAVLDIDGNGATAALTDGLLVLRFLFGFTGPTLTTGAVDLSGCTRCDAGSIEAYLHTLV